MKIRLLVDLPIDGKHGANKGRVFEVIREERGGRCQNKLFFIGDAGEECAALHREWEVAKEARNE